MYHDPMMTRDDLDRTTSIVMHAWRRRPAPRASGYIDHPLTASPNIYITTVLSGSLSVFSFYIYKCSTLCLAVHVYVPGVT